VATRSLESFEHLAGQGDESGLGLVGSPAHPVGSQLVELAPHGEPVLDERSLDHGRRAAVPDHA